MQITGLRLLHYRNIKELEIFPSAGTSLFSGRNGQGNTNLLESICFLGYGKSFRTSTPKDCIQHGQQECHIEGTVENGQLKRDLHVLAFTHKHLNVVRGGPADRRAFLDGAMVYLYPGHVSYLAAYGRALKQRNMILASALEGTAASCGSLLDSWDEALIGPGPRVLWNRLRYVEQMKETLPQGLFDTEALKMHYASSAAPNDASVPQIEESFHQRLIQARTSDQKNRIYLSGAPSR